MAKELLDREELRKTWERLTDEQRSKLWRLVNGLTQKDPEIVALMELAQAGQLSNEEVMNRL